MRPLVKPAAFFHFHSLYMFLWMVIKQKKKLFDLIDDAIFPFFVFIEQNCIVRRTRDRWIENETKKM